MNRIYRVIWSQVRGAYVVVSEIAKSHTRGSKSFVSNSAKATVKVGLAAMVLTCGSGLISGVQAESDRGVALTPANADPADPKEHTAGGVTWLTPKPGAPTINMFDYNTPGNKGQGYLYTNNKVFGIQLVIRLVHVLMMDLYLVFLSAIILTLVDWVWPLVIMHSPTILALLR